MLRDQVRIQPLGQRPCDAGYADIEGDVSRQLALGETEVAEAFGDRAAEMIRCQKERRGPVRVLPYDRRSIGAAQK